VLKERLTGPGPKGVEEIWGDVRGRQLWNFPSATGTSGGFFCPKSNCGCGLRGGVGFPRHSRGLAKPAQCSRARSRAKFQCSRRVAITQ